MIMHFESEGVVWHTGILKLLLYARFIMIFIADFWAIRLECSIHDAKKDSWGL